jgi:hypothetical protein
VALPSHLAGRGRIVCCRCERGVDSCSWIRVHSIGTVGRADPMSAIERLLVPGCTELPVCQCGDEMRIASLDPIPETTDAHIRIYKCPSCAREMRLTVWASDPTP